MKNKCEPASRFSQEEDDVLLPYIKTIVNERASYGYRRVTTLLNRRLQLENKPKVNHKRIYRIMKRHSLLLPAYGKKPTRLHDGKVITLHVLEACIRIVNHCALPNVSSPHRIDPQIKDFKKTK